MRNVLLWAITVPIILTVGIILLYIIDTYNMPLKQDHLEVINKTYVEAYNTTMYINTGSVLVPITERHPEVYQLTIKLNKLSDQIAVDQMYYSHMLIGTKVCCNYTSGRIFNSFYIKSLCN